MKKRTRFDVLRELKEVEDQLAGSSVDNLGFVKRVTVPTVELQKQRALLRHELKQFDTKTAEGEDAEAIKKFHKRRLEEERKKQEEEKKKEQERIKQAKKQLIENEDSLDEIINNLSPEQREKLKKKL